MKNAEFDSITTPLLKRIAEQFPSNYEVSIVARHTAPEQIARVPGELKKASVATRGNRPSRQTESSREAVGFSTPGRRVRYVAGFMFSPDMKRVALIRKLKPEWQKGLLNGIGGKVEEGETAREAMEREFQEETGCISSVGWWHFADLIGPEWRVHFFTTRGNVDECESKTAEKVEIREVDLFRLAPGDTIENLPWLMALAIDFLNDKRPSFVEARYA